MRALRVYVRVCVRGCLSRVRGCVKYKMIMGVAIENSRSLLARIVAIAPFEQVCSLSPDFFQFKRT